MPIEIDQEARSERIAIKCDSGISEADAIRQTDAEHKADPECVLKAKALQDRIKLDHAEKQLKKQRRIYE